MSSKTNDEAKIRKKNRSITVQLSAGIIFSDLLKRLTFDIVYVVLLTASFCYNAQMSEIGVCNIENSSFTVVSDEQGLEAVLTGLIYNFCDNSGTSFSINASHFASFLIASTALLVAIQIFLLLVSCISVPIKTNKKLKPLYTMAEATRALSQFNPEDEYYSTLRDAINGISPANSDQTIHTGKKELIVLENAVNSMLERMRESYKSQNRFVSDASHELRTPIAVIQGYANMLDRWGREDPEILAESITAIKSEADNMNRLVENLLFLARGDSGRTIVRIEKVNINQLLCDIYDEFVMIDTTHEFRLDLRGDVTAEVDISLLKQCLRILIDNAIKYSPTGSDIIIRLQKRGETHCAVEIQDYGMGIKAEDASKVFERFYRSDPARNRQNGGLGLGLSIAKWIADKHGGCLELLSYENVGTRISLVLPVISKVKPTVEEADISEEKSN